MFLFAYINMCSVLGNTGGSEAGTNAYNYRTTIAVVMLFVFGGMIFDVVPSTC